MRIDYFNAKPIDDIRGFAYNMMIGSKGPSDALAADHQLGAKYLLTPAS